MSGQIRYHESDNQYDSINCWDACVILASIFFEVFRIASKIELCTSQIRPLFGKRPSRKYSRMAFAIQKDVADTEPCCESIVLSNFPICRTYACQAYPGRVLSKDNGIVELGCHLVCAGGIMMRFVVNNGWLTYFISGVTGSVKKASILFCAKTNQLRWPATFPISNMG